ncbi:MAG: SUMF1/EgtB/PvdO family nonheme iron enzyme [Fibrobacteria bacterium]|nr:SUMF1/EgtB/PvdO family nonheme iron enzyme [Fibrobacteria bacterium]
MTPPPANKRAPSGRLWPILALVMLALLVLLLMRSCTEGRFPLSSKGPQTEQDSARWADSLARLDSLQLLATLLSLDSIALQDSLRRLDSLRTRLDSLSRLDSLQKARLRATRPLPRDSSPRPLPVSGRSRLDSLRELTGDSLPPFVYADPAPGVHPAPVDAAFIVLEKGGTPLCGPAPDSLAVCRDLVRIIDHKVLWVTGEDSVGNRAPIRRMEWIIDPDASRCGIRRALVPRPDGSEICVDAYEYPNDPSRLPSTSVNWEEASAICSRLGRRLCRAEELKDACQGPQGWSFPYGSSYVPGYCQVSERKLGRGVGKPACRSWWGAYQLVGNAWEWTSTANGSGYLTSGGTFEGGPDVRCGKTSKSFFAQNRYEAVGFRCCEDLPAR